MKPWRITFTGIDERTDIPSLVELARSESRLEFGVLYSEPATRTRRYPSLEWIKATAPLLRTRGVPLALHVCGSAVYDLLREPHSLKVLSEFERIQLNGCLDFGSPARFDQLLTSHPYHSVITQFDANPELHRIASGRAHQVLFDASGGRGLPRANWPTPLTGVTCGYAGGLGPETLETALPEIVRAAGARVYWIDMETQLRSGDDWFSLDRAYAALSAIHRAEASSLLA